MAVGFLRTIFFFPLHTMTDSLKMFLDRDICHPSPPFWKDCPSYFDIWGAYPQIDTMLFPVVFLTCTCAK